MIYITETIRQERKANELKTLSQSREHGVSVKEVKRDIQAAVDHAYAKPNFHARCVFSESEKPTVDEFIAHATRVAKARI
jgi:hypothetical protein